MDKALQGSFNALRRTARCANDVIDWIQEHPQLLPGVPQHILHTVKLSKLSAGFADINIQSGKSLRIIFPVNYEACEEGPEIILNEDAQEQLEELFTNGVRIGKMEAPNELLPPSLALTRYVWKEFLLVG